MKMADHGCVELSEGLTTCDHNGRSYTVTVMKTGKLIMQNTRQICSTPIPIEQYLQEQIKKEIG